MPKNRLEEIDLGVLLENAKQNALKNVKWGGQSIGDIPPLPGDRWDGPDPQDAKLVARHTAFRTAVCNYVGALVTKGVVPKTVRCDSLIEETKNALNEQIQRVLWQHYRVHDEKKEILAIIKAVTDSVEKTL